MPTLNAESLTCASGICERENEREINKDNKTEVDWEERARGWKTVKERVEK